MQKKLFALALGMLLFGGSLGIAAATQAESTPPQATCCDGNGPCCDKPCCDHCPDKARS